MVAVVISSDLEVTNGILIREFAGNCFAPLDDCGHFLWVHLCVLKRLEHGGWAKVGERQKVFVWV